MSQLSGISVWRFLKSTAFAFLGVFIFIFLFFTLLLGNLFQIITLIFYPISPLFFRKLNTGLAAWWWGMGAWFLTIAGAKVNIVGDDFCVVPDGFAEDDSCCIRLMSSRCRFSEGVVWIGDGNMFVYFS